TDTIKLGKKIGSGAQAEIFKAQCGLDDVVVKRFLDMTHSSTKQEVEILKQLTHKHIVQFYYVHHDMLVMEYVEGGSLANAIVGRTLQSWEVKTRIAKDISLGLAYLHCQGIIHCDIKSSNILLTEHKEARICDFGLAMRTGDRGGGGTLQWMAPELLWNPPQYTEKSDVYALGMVIWEMASGSTRPYREHTPDGVVYCILNGILEEYSDDTPKAYSACIQMCWSLTSEGRPAAVNILPDIEQSPNQQDEPEQQQRGVIETDDKVHYLKALKQYFKTSKSPGFMDILKNNGMLLDNKMMDWFDGSTGGHGSAKAMLQMGTMYYHSASRGVEQDYGAAMEWYLAASEAGVAAAMLKLSQMYQHGRGVERDANKELWWYCKAEEAVNMHGKHNHRIIHHENAISEHHGRTMEWFRNTAAVGPATDKLDIGYMYISGEHLEQDDGKAMEWFLKATHDGNATAMYYIGIMYIVGRGVEQDFGKAMEWLLKAGNAGNVDAMQCIGVMYNTGRGVEQDYGKAMEWLLRAGDAGHVDAMQNIGVLYNTGRGVEQDYGKAMEWCLKASDAGNVDAMQNIGVMYNTGQGVEQDYGKAMEWFLKASDAGNVDAMQNIGVMYNTGQGVEKDYGKAMEWFFKASDAGNAAAKFSIGFMFYSGEVVEPDYSMALDWYLEASDAGNVDAMFYIGNMYEKGLEVEQDYGKAREWYLKSGSTSNADRVLKTEEESLNNHREMQNIGVHHHPACID
ncbi:hypothetical protein BGZ68_002813, partial [Mortierella alpina]